MHCSSNCLRWFHACISIIQSENSLRSFASHRHEIVIKCSEVALISNAIYYTQFNASRNTENLLSPVLTREDVNRKLNSTLTRNRRDKGTLRRLRRGTSKIRCQRWWFDDKLNREVLEPMEMNTFSKNRWSVLRNSIWQKCRSRIIIIDDVYHCIVYSVYRWTAYVEIPKCRQLFTFSISINISKGLF